MTIALEALSIRTVRPSTGMSSWVELRGGGLASLAEEDRCCVLDTSIRPVGYSTQKDAGLPYSTAVSTGGRAAIPSIGVSCIGGMYTGQDTMSISHLDMFIASTNFNGYGTCGDKDGKTDKRVPEIAHVTKITAQNRRVKVRSKNAWCGIYMSVSVCVRESTSAKPF